MKKIVPWIIILMALAACMYCFIYFFAVPKTAQELVPYKWKALLLEKKRGNMVAYLGRPVDSILKGNTDTWVSRNGNLTYTLIVQYNLQDTSVKKYTVFYDFKNTIFNRSQLIATDSTK